MTEPGAARPRPSPHEASRRGDSSTAQPIPAAEQDAITQALADIAPVRFVAAREAALTNGDGCGIVRDDGILMVLGPAQPKGSAYHVPVNGFKSCTGATWITYVVERSGDGFAVTGTTGPMAVS